MTDTVDLSGIEQVKNSISNAMRQIEGDLAKFNERLKQSTSPSSSGGLVNFDRMLGNIRSSLLGATGVAAGLIAVGRALDQMSVSSIQMQMFARDMRLSTDNVEDLRQGMARLGMSTAESDRQIGSIANKLNDLATFKENSALWQELSKYPGAGVEIANTLMKMAEAGQKTGSQLGTINEVLSFMGRQSEQTKHALSQTFDIPASLAEKLPNAMRNNIKEIRLSEEAVERYRNQWVDFETTFRNLQKLMGAEAMEGANTIKEALDSVGVSVEGVNRTMVDGVRDFSNGLRQALIDLNSIGEIVSALKENKFGEAGELTGKFLGLEKYQYGPRKPADLDLPQGEDPMGADYTRGISAVGRVHGWMNRNNVPSLSKLFKRSDSGTSSATDFSGMRRQQVEEESNTRLREIRDILQRMETKDDERSTGGDPSATAETGRRALGRRLGIDRSTATDDTPAGSGPRAGRMTTNQRDVAKIMREEWANAGMSEKGIAGIMANVQDESRFNPTLRHPDQPRFSGEAHYAHGLYQEGGTEWNNYDAWLKKNYPGSDWRDPRLQSRFAAERLKAAYPQTWRKMLNAQSGGEAGAAYVDEYLKPAAGYRASRMARYRRGVPGVESYTGDMDRNAVDRDQASQGAFGKLNGEIRFLNVPPGVSTKMEAEGDVFHQLQITRTKQSGVFQPGTGAPGYE